MAELRHGFPPRDSYHGVEITHPELQSIFDPVVAQILDLISTLLRECGGESTALVVGGGFAESPYLLDCIRRRFYPRSHTTSARLTLAARSRKALALHPELVVSRICKRTYGFANREHFETGDPEEYLVTSDGDAQCRNQFRILVRKWDAVRVHDCVSTTCTASWKPTWTTFLLKINAHDVFTCQFCEDTDPRYTTADSVKEEGAFCVTDVSGVAVLSKHRTLETSPHHIIDQMQKVFT